MKRHGILTLTFLLIAMAGFVSAETPVRVVASTTDLAAIAEEVGGNLVTVEALCRGDQDPHEFEILPSQVMVVQQADVYLKVGLALDLWADKLMESAGNKKLVIADCSRDVAVIGGQTHEGPHPFGNPHYWLAPSNAPVIAATIRDALQKADPEHTSQYAANDSIFAAKIDSAKLQWQRVLALCHGWALVTSHPSWDYFARDFGIEIAGTVSRVPDAEPTPMDLATLEQTIRSRGHCVFLREPFTSDRFPTVLTRDTGIPVIIAPSSVGATPEARSLWTQFDFLTAELAKQCQTAR